MGISRTIIRALSGVSNTMTWISSAIVVGLTGYFLAHYPRDGHLIYEIVIGALTLFFWIPAMVLPFLRSYKSYLLPLNLIFSYLWLTSFIFAAQDYNRHACWANSPTFGRCSLKYALEAFIFLAFFFTFIAALSDILGFRGSDDDEVNNQVRVEKNTGRSSAETAV